MHEVVQGAADRATRGLVQVGMMWAVLDTDARRLRDGGDSRDLNALRYDVFVDMALGKFDSRVQTHVYLHVPATTIAGITDDPGIVAGYGPVTAERCRELAAGSAVWKRVFTDPVDGTVKDVGRRSYRPPGGLAEYVKVRDATCMAPGCIRSSHECQIDHTVPWAEGGCTCSTNLAALCFSHHRLRHLCGWSIAQAVRGCMSGSARWGSGSLGCRCRCWNRSSDAGWSPFPGRLVVGLVE